MTFTPVPLPRRRQPHLVILVVTTAILGGCLTQASPSASLRPDGRSPSAGAVGAPTSLATPSPTLLPATPPPASATPSAPAPPAPSAAPTVATAATVGTSCALRTLGSMTEAQRIGQLFMVGLADDRLGATLGDAIATYHFGSVLFVKGSTAGVAAIRAVSDAVQARATMPATHRVPFFIAANQEGGQVQALKGPGFAVMPSALEQGSLSPARLQSLATGWGAELRAAGVNLDLAPVADVVPPGTDDQNAPIGQYDREYGHDPGTVADHVAAFIAGMRAAGVATTAKHFPGLGRATGNTDHTADVVDTITTRHDPYLAPFARAVTSHVIAVMISLATYEEIDPTHLAAFSDTVINGMLRGDLGFRGMVVSDSLGATAVASLPPATRAMRFLDAGGDLIVVNRLDQATAMATAIASLAASADWFRARVDNAAWHVLRAKEAAGLLTCR